MNSFVSPDPVGIVLAWIPVALAILALAIALFISTVALYFDVVGRRYRRVAAQAHAPLPA